MLVTACARETNPPPVDNCPGWVKELGWSSRDTEETRREIHDHNFKYDTFCKRVAPGGAADVGPGADVGVR